MKKVVKVFAWFIILLTLASLLYGVSNYESIKSLSQTAVKDYGVPAVFIISFLLDLFPQFLSGHNLVLVAGLLSMNPYKVVVAVLIATFLASVIGFWLGKKFGGEVFKEIFGKKNYKKIDKGMKKYGKWYTAISAISPLPYIPIIFGSLDMDWKDFMIYGVVPRMLGFLITAIFVYTALPLVLKFFGT